jgi:hypothetical protein
LNQSFDDEKKRFCNLSLQLSFFNKASEENSRHRANGDHYFGQMNTSRIIKPRKKSELVPNSLEESLKVVDKKIKSIGSLFSSTNTKMLSEFADFCCHSLKFIKIREIRPYVC